MCSPVDDERGRAEDAEGDGLVGAPSQVVLRLRTRDGLEDAARVVPRRPQHVAHRRLLARAAPFDPVGAVEAVDDTRVDAARDRRPQRLHGPQGVPGAA